jgi:hypothetical protein
MLSKKIAVTNIEGLGIVSTVRLPKVYAPQQYETIVFSDIKEIGDYLTRSSTEDEAMQVHIDTINLILKVNKNYNGEEND